MRNAYYSLNDGIESNLKVGLESKISIQFLVFLFSKFLIVGSVYIFFIYNILILINFIN